MRSNALFGMLILLSASGVSSLFIGSFTLPPWFFSDPIRAIANEFCPYFAKQPTRGQTAITKFNEILQKTNETRQLFVTTITYLSLSSNQEKLTGGTQTCTLFFNELRDSLVTDWRNRNFSPSNALQKALELFTTFRDVLRSFIQSRN